MTIWLFIGVFFGAFLLLWLGRSLYRTAKAPELKPDPGEQRRQADHSAADAARIADARMPPFQSGPGGPV